MIAMLRFLSAFPRSLIRIRNIIGTRKLLRILELGISLAFGMMRRGISRQREARPATCKASGRTKLPPILLVSLTGSCNLACRQCFLTGNTRGCAMTVEKMREILDQAVQDGVGLVGLTGGEPFLVPRIIRLVPEYPSLYFFVFTNGTLIDREAIRFLAPCTNLMITLGADGPGGGTDVRRGAGTEKRLREVLARLASNRIPAGISVMVTKKNLRPVTSSSWMEELVQLCACFMFYVPYTASGRGAEPGLMLSEEEITYLGERELAMAINPGIMAVSRHWRCSPCLFSTGRALYIGETGELGVCPGFPYSNTVWNGGSLSESLGKSRFLKAVYARQRKKTACIFRTEPNQAASLIASHNACSAWNRDAYRMLTERARTERTERTRTSLESVMKPGSVKKLRKVEIERLASSIRELLVDVISENGGHLASNLGSIELSIALHRAFDSPSDKIIWDVGHQCYSHKMLTGRASLFGSIRKKGGISGFPNRDESVHDAFGTGHASTSISAALGIACAEELKGESNNIVAVIGDGALSGGMALEALNHAGSIGKKIIVVLNDNGMSISKPVGVISEYLAMISLSPEYRAIKGTVSRFVKAIPLIGCALYDFIHRVKAGLGAFLFKPNLFRDLGFEYIGPVAGHDVTRLHRAFELAKRASGPVIVHAITLKGKGYAPAEGNPEEFHGLPSTKAAVKRGSVRRRTSFCEAFGCALASIAEKDDRVVAITAAMKDGTGLTRFSRSFPERFFDVGICEEHAVTFASGLACAGIVPVVAVYSTFMQRAADQLIHDVALQRLPVIIVMAGCGLVGEDGPTHHGLYDIALFKPIPGITIISPSNETEVEESLRYAIALHGPALIRFPKAECPPASSAAAEPFVAGRGAWISKSGGLCLILSPGSLVKEALEASRMLGPLGIKSDVYCLRFIAPLDWAHLSRIAADYERLIIVEDGIQKGGICEETALHLMQNGFCGDIAIRGVPQKSIPHASREEQLAMCGLDAEGIAKLVIANIQDKRIA